MGEAFNEGDAEKLSSFYSTNAINHQVANEPIEGKEAIQNMFMEEFANANMVCIVEDFIFEDGQWAIRFNGVIGINSISRQHNKTQLLKTGTISLSLKLCVAVVKMSFVDRM